MEPDYGKISEEEIIKDAKAGDIRAVECLINKYKGFVHSKTRMYYLVGADADDIVQEGYIGLYKAIRDYDGEKPASFRSFAELCITRQIMTAIKTATRQKHMPLNTYISLDKSIYGDEANLTLMDVIDEGPLTNPEAMMINQEERSGLEARMSEILSSLEWEALSLFLQGRSYQEVAEQLDRQVKSIDNALQRVKKKLEKFLEESRD